MPLVTIAGRLGDLGVDELERVKVADDVAVAPVWIARQRVQLRQAQPECFGNFFSFHLALFWMFSHIMCVFTTKM